MFCPKCKSEYREGFYRCADCEVDLIAELPEENDANYREPDPDVEMVPILTTSNAADIGIVKSILDDSGISYFFQGENVTFLRREGEATLFVLEDDAEQVRELLKDINIAASRNTDLMW